MCYRCKNCNVIVKAGTPMRKYTYYRTKTEQYGEGTRELREISGEVPVCEECAPKMTTADFNHNFGK
jgi:hypothetical protein